jgi:probable HAF family extracellular repeat protein
MDKPNRLKSLRRSAIPALCTVLLSFAAPSFAIEYKFVPLAKIIDGNEQYYWGDHARTINNSNQILMAVDPSTGRLGYRIDWQGQNAVYTPLESLVGTNNTYEVNGFNNNGHLAGSSLTTWGCPGLGCSSAFKWEGGAKIPLDSQGRSSRAFAINDAGQTVGVSYPVNNEDASHAALWSNGTFTDLGGLGGGTSKANDINNNGAVVGYSYPGAGSWETRATLWENGAIQDLGTLGGTGSYASAINDNGQIAGFAERADGLDRPVLWDNGVIVDLMGSKNPTLRGFANDLNSHGAAVGRFGNSLDKAALFQNGNTADLNWFLSEDERNYWLLRNARSINDNGWIVGDAMNMSFEHWAFVLIPQVPEPSAYLMSGIGIVLTLFSVRRRTATSTRFSMS